MQVRYAAVIIIEKSVDSAEVSRYTSDVVIRAERVQSVLRLLRSFPVVAIVGARQVGKTTLARQIANRFRGNVSWFDLEDNADIARLSEPGLALRELKGLVVIDEIQRMPNIFPALRVLVDKPGRNQKFLILGSASPHMLKQGSETLAGRVSYYTLNGFCIDEVGVDNATRLWLRGGFPRSYLANSEKLSSEWRREFIKTFLERDIPNLGISIGAKTLERFWSMLAHYHGQIWNSSEFAASFGVADTTVRRYLDLLTSTFVVRQLQPWHENIKKRQVKSPKIYFSDSGILHTMLGLSSRRDVERHPKLGASWEGFVIENIIRAKRALPEECYFWRTHGGAELDLLIVRGLKKWGFEIKRTESPNVTPSMISSIRDLTLDELTVVHSGTKSFPLQKNIRAVAIRDLMRMLEKH